MDEFCRPDITPRAIHWCSYTKANVQDVAVTEGISFVHLISEALNTSRASKTILVTGCMQCLGRGLNPGGAQPPGHMASCGPHKPLRKELLVFALYRISSISHSLLSEDIMHN